MKIAVERVSFSVIYILLFFVGYGAISTIHKGAIMSKNVGRDGVCEGEQSLQWYL